MYTRGIFLFIALVAGVLAGGDGKGEDIFEEILKANKEEADEKADPAKVIEGDIVLTKQLQKVIDGNDEKEDGGNGKGNDIFETILEANKEADEKSDKDLVEGDIMPSARFMKIRNGNDEENDEADAALFTRYTGSKWPYAEILFIFSPGMNSELKNAVRAAAADYSRLTCIRFRELRSTRGAKNYLYFVAEGGCFSYIGMQGGRQKVSLGEGCEHKGVAIHEMMHALGFFHEHTRRDRDQYLRINFENIKKGKESNFKMYGAKDASTLGFPYDKKSIMQYGAKAFSKNGRNTIQALEGGDESIGQRNGLSKIDILQLKAYYCKNGGGGVSKPKPQRCSDRASNCRENRNYCRHPKVKLMCCRTCGM